MNRILWKETLVILLKGDEISIAKDGFAVKAIVIKMLTPTLALARIMEGSFAGEEVETDLFLDLLAGPKIH